MIFNLSIGKEKLVKIREDRGWELEGVGIIY